MDVCIVQPLRIGDLHLERHREYDADRLHARKKFRPFAAGMLSVPAGWAIASTLLLLAIGVVQVAVSSLAALTLISYVVATSAYTMWLKREPVVDIFTLAATSASGQAAWPLEFSCRTG